MVGLQNGRMVKQEANRMLHLLNRRQEDVTKVGQLDSGV